MVLPRGCGAVPPSLQLRHHRAPGQRRRLRGHRGPPAGLGAPCPGCQPQTAPGVRGGGGRSRSLTAVDTDEMRSRLRKQGIPNWQLAEPSLPLDEESNTFLTLTPGIKVTCAGSFVQHAAVPALPAFQPHS
ncbi:uncharacterized protein LOC116450917 [Corvus moneduloides]|uniref:uncharacterized protein LOC116450917 n=1 Tax=Corvus moneduloides TaxID=1196302 RepID=UPI001363AA6F|nr:uncharacterized protein LOC116450917 [Corvus moneduloides]